MIRDYRTDEIKEYITRLQNAGTVGCSNSYKGISSSDEQHLTALLMSATPSYDLPTLNELDIHNGLPLMVARYVDSGHAETAIELATYLKNLYVDYFKETIKRLMEEHANERELV